MVGSLAPMTNPFDDLPPVSQQPLATNVAPGANPFDDLPPISQQHAAAEAPKAPATAADRLQAAEAGMLKGEAYIAGAIPDAFANAKNLGVALYDAGRHYIGGADWADLPRPGELSPVGHAIANQLDKSPVTTTQLARPDDTASRYLSAAGSAGVGLAAGGQNLTSTVRSALVAAPAVAGGQALADSGHPTLATLAQTLYGVTTARSAGAPTAVGQKVKAAQDLDFEFPPATTNPGPLNRALETVAGKQNVQQHASLNNQGSSNALGRRVLGADPGKDPLTESDFATAKANAAPAYDALRTAGNIKTTPAFGAAIDKALKANQGASRLASSLGDSALTKTLGQLKKTTSFDASDGVDAISALRDQASSAFRAGNTNLGKAYKAAGKAVEDAMDTHLSAQGGASADLLTDYRAARQQFARIGTVEDAWNPTTGNLVAPKLAAARKSGDYMDGELRTLADAAGQAPLAFKEPTASAGAHHLGLWGSLAGAAGAHQFIPGHAGAATAVGLAALPVARYGARQAALGIDSRAVPTGKGPADLARALAAYTTANGRPSDPDNK